MPPSNPPLPVDALLPQLLQQLEYASTVLLQAPPGAGKTTRVPPALLAAGWRGDGRILMLEPRRLVARAAARFMAGGLGEPVGKTVGFRTRLESRVSAETRIEVVTEGILLRMLQNDPELSGIAAVLFDEFHERSLNADLGLALVREVQQSLRPELRVVVMSATLDTAPLAKLLDDAPVLSSEGRSFPVEAIHLPPARSQDAVNAVPAAVRRALKEQAGSILVFLPGEAEIRRVARALAPLESEDLRLHPLFGALSPAEQDAAIAQAPPGIRKIVLSTSIAETSLTIEGVRAVIDAGLDRRARFDPGSGMSRLVTGRVSRAAAEQRRGRAGRIEPGVCYRLWPESEQARLAAFSPPEIVEADLASTVLELAAWGTREPAALAWLDPPPAAHWNQAVELLQSLEALDQHGVIRASGRAMLATGLHPRLAHMLVRSRELGSIDDAARLAAILSERDPLGREAGADLETRVAALREGRSDRRWQRLRELARRLGAEHGSTCSRGGPSVGALLALAYPDRIGQHRPGGLPRYQLSNGRGAWLAEDDPLGASDWLVAAELDGRAREARIFLGARIGIEDIETLLTARIRTTEDAEWDEARGTVIVRRRRKLGALVLDQREAGRATAEQLTEGLLAAVRKHGLERLGWSERACQFAARAERVRRELHPNWPAFDPATLGDELGQWLGPFLAGMTHSRQVKALDLIPALEARLGHQRKRELDRLAPTHLNVPSGHSVALDWCAESGPVLGVKLQAVFGWESTPRLLDGRASVVLHLLSPAGRPLAITADLASFWVNAYPEVARDMRGRYPKHPWPVDPTSAVPTLATRRRGG